MERYFLDLEDEESLLKDVDDNWNVDMNLAIEVAAKKHRCTNKQVLQLLPLDKFVDYLIYNKIIPNINRYDFIDHNFTEDWLNSSGPIGGLL